MRLGSKTMSRRRFVTHLGAAAVLAAAAPHRIRAQPAAKPLKIIVPYPAGGPTDAMARLLAKELSEVRAASVVVENKPGAAGALGTREVARAEPDGTTLVLGTNQTHVTNAVLLKEPGYDTRRDFVPVASLAGLQHVLVVPKQAAAVRTADLVAKTKAEPGKLNYGSTGLGSGSHLAMVLFMARAGITMTHVPFRGAAPMAIEVVAGRLDAAFATLPSVLGQIEGGEIKALALASPQRAPQLPTLPLLADDGFKDADSDAWLALFAPRATSPAVVGQLSSAVASIMRKPEVVAGAAKLGMAVSVREAGAMTAFMEAETAKWLDVVRQSGLKPE